MHAAKFDMFARRAIVEPTQYLCDPLAVVRSNQRKRIVAHLQTLGDGISRNSFDGRIDPDQSAIRPVPAFPVVRVVSDCAKPSVIERICCHAEHG